MRILIIGGTGFIGPHVVRWLVEQDAEVTVFHRGQTRAEPAPEVAEIPQWLARSGKTGKLPLGVGEILGSRECLADFTAFKKLEPDVVLDMFPMNETDARAVMGTFEGLAGRVVAVSSSDVYRAFNRLRRIEPGPPDPVPLSEDAPPCARSCTPTATRPRGPAIHCMSTRRSWLNAWSWATRICRVRSCGCRRCTAPATRCTGPLLT